MPARLIAQVQRVVLVVILQVEFAGFETGMTGQRAALRAGSTEILDDNTHRNAGPAMVTVRAVGEGAAAAEPGANQLAVDRSVDQVAWRRNLRARHPVRQIAAGIGRGRIELQDREREIREKSHRQVPT